MRNLIRAKTLRLRLWLHDKFCWAFGIESAYLHAIKQAIDEIATLKRTVARLDRGNSLDVRSQMSMLDIDKYGDIVWIKVSDDRMLRYDVFNQVRDYLRGHGKDRAILILTGNNVEIASLTDEDLKKALLRRMTKEEEKSVLEGSL